ncbi:hypothetical protein SAMN05444274_105210 [Mariniphaga anaerophila]|uniref:O-Antigen ligase n=2 Tax=Mariniphaga anaerophila TaxID=1484053 RepID=A0A1M5BN15_9BACT|nr:hypothetical protein SAMN05444274_105210 [Mariniphaga anaerophila]
MLSLRENLPMFFMLCFSGNPMVTSQSYSNSLLIGYTVLLLFYVFFVIDLQIFKKSLGIFIGLLLSFSVIVFSQRIILGFVSYPGVLGIILKTILGLATLLLYQNQKVDFLDAYIKVMTFLAILSLPFFLLNQFGVYGLDTGKSLTKSLLIYTSFYPFPGEVVARNSGMFWEPGAFSGYLILALLFIALKNRKFQIGPYRKEIPWILIGLLTTMSTTGFIVLGVIITINSLQNYKFGKLVFMPIAIIIMYYSYYSLDFMKEKIDYQYSLVKNMNENDVSNTRMGAFYMDLKYIKSQPIIGNGLHIKTRFRFHHNVTGDIGHGNGMSNFMASWGIPLFLFWLFCVFKFALKVSRSYWTSFSVLFIIILLLQGEQFLNYPVFLSFFFLPFVYQNILSKKNKIHLIKNYFNINFG